MINLYGNDSDSQQSYSYSPQLNVYYSFDNRSLSRKSKY